MTVGILGGMGPAASVLFASRLVSMTAADSDRDHVPFIFASPNTIPDRSAYLIGESETSPFPALLRECRRLVSAGADFLVITCNTAHAFLPLLRAEIAAPIFDMPALTAKEAARCGFRHVGLLSTRGTLETGIFERALAPYGIGIVKPTSEEQRAVDSAIVALKGARHLPKRALAETADALLRRGADALILGCTELSLIDRVIRGKSRKVIDPMTLLARESILYAGKKLREKRPTAEKGRARALPGRYSAVAENKH